jgi:D-galactose 1-dehydrogenase
VAATGVTKPLQFGLVGLGKIARDQHLPAIAATAGAELVAVASRNATAQGVRNYSDLATMLAGEPALDAVILCQPPEARFEAAAIAIMAGKHVFLEKPPGATVSEVVALTTLAEARKVTLFASWHSRYGAAVEPARAWGATRKVRSVAIRWKEDIRIWHPGQDWILEAGGFGVFDPGINALSILTRVITEPVRMIAATLDIPANRAAPIAASLAMKTAGGAPVSAVFDFLQTGQQSWDIDIETDSGTLHLSDGGNRIAVDGVARDVGSEAEYPAMYRHFVDLIHGGESDVDVAPLQLVADAFLCGRVTTTKAFIF